MKMPSYVFPFPLQKTKLYKSQDQVTVQQWKCHHMFSLSLYRKLNFTKVKTNSWSCRKNFILFHTFTFTVIKCNHSLGDSLFLVVSVFGGFFVFFLPLTICISSLLFCPYSQFTFYHIADQPLFPQEHYPNPSTRMTIKTLLLKAQSAGGVKYTNCISTEG